MNVKEFVGKFKKASDENRLSHALKSRILPYLNQIKYLHNPGKKYIELSCPEYVTPNESPEEKIIVERIYNSFKKMKEAQVHDGELYKPATIWQNHIDKSYHYLIDGIKENDINKFHFFLSNFGAWKSYHGIESNALLNAKKRTIVGRHYLKNVLFHQNFQLWSWFYNARKPLSKLAYPRYGNQMGANIKDETGDQVFVGSGSFFNEIYGSLLSNLIDDVKRPIIADLGGGYGKLAYFTLRDLEDFCFIDFDLPETLCLAAYYLMKAWPTKKVLLFGEAEFDTSSFEQYDMIFMPSSMIERLKSNCIDLFLNKNSLGEMNSDAAINYLKYISLSTKYFFHMNHDIHPNIYGQGKRGLLGYEYPINSENFKLIMRYSDIGHMLHNGSFDKYMDIFFYLYEKRKFN
jgi:putative sugar O-methyltransferase